MSVAFFVESVTDNGSYQTLVIPTANTVLSFHRLSTGQRGRATHWGTTDTLPEALITFEPSAVLITEKDVANAELGNVTNLAIKLMGASKTASVGEVRHDVQVAEIIEALYQGNDDYLNKFVKDGRRKTPLALKFEPILETAFYPAVAVAPEPVYAPVAPSAPSNVVSITPPAEPANKPVSTVLDLAQVPDAKWATDYIEYSFGKVGLFSVLDVAMENHQNVLIRGHAGSGKTMGVLAYSAIRNYRYYNVSANVGLEPSHLFGAWTPTEQAGVFKWQDGPVTDLVRNGGVLLLNEIDFMPERITTVLFGLLDDRREIQLLENGGEVIKAHPNLLVVGDHNPNYRGSRPMNQAWKDRFVHKLEVGYDKAIERKLIPSKALLEVAEKLREQVYKGEIETPVSTRGLMGFVKNAQNISLAYAIDSYLNGFSDDEREAVKLVFDTAKSNVAKDFGIDVVVSAKQSDED